MESHSEYHNYNTRNKNEKVLPKYNIKVLYKVYALNPINIFILRWGDHSDDSSIILALVWR